MQKREKSPIKMDKLFDIAHANTLSIISVQNDKIIAKRNGTAKE